MERLTSLVLNDLRENYHDDLDSDSMIAVDRIMKETKWRLHDKKHKKKAVSVPVIIKYLSRKDWNYYYFVFEAIVFEYNKMLFYEIGTRYYRGTNEELAKNVYNMIVE